MDALAVLAGCHVAEVTEKSDPAVVAFRKSDSDGRHSTDLRLCIDTCVTVVPSVGDGDNGSRDGVELSSLVGMTVATVDLQSDASLEISFTSGQRMVVQTRTVSPPWWLQPGDHTA